MNAKQLNEKSLYFELIWERIQSWILVHFKRLKIEPSSKDIETQFKLII